MKQTFKVKGVHCSSCSLNIEWCLEDLGVKAKCDYPKNSLEIEYDPQKVNKEQIEKALFELGYEVN